MIGIVFLLLVKIINAESVDRRWSVWAKWNTCVGGTQYRTRLCNHSPTSTGGKDCVGNNSDSRECAKSRCSDLTDGGAWGSCNTSCGEAYKWRKRKCIYNGQVVNVDMCQDDPWEYFRCHITPCQEPLDTQSAGPVAVFSEPESTFSIGPVAGGVGAVLVVLLVVLGAIFIVRRRRQMNDRGRNEYEIRDINQE